MNTSEIDTDSEPVHDAMIVDWIREASGIISMYADSHSVSLTDEDAVRVADRGVKAFAISKILQTMSVAEVTVARYWNEWLDSRAAVESRITTLGDAYSAVTGLPTNVDKDNPKQRTWPSFNDERGDGFTGF